MLFWSFFRYDLFNTLIYLRTCNIVFYKQGFEKKKILVSWHKHLRYPPGVLKVYRLLVSLGAVNMILVLLFGSFAQQSVQQSLRRVAMGSSSIDRSTAYQSSPYSEHISILLTDLNLITFRRFFNYDFGEQVLLTCFRWRDEQRRELTELPIWLRSTSNAIGSRSWPDQHRHKSFECDGWLSYR